MARKSFELTNPESCLNRAAHDEPVFVIRANDDIAPEIVRAWATEYVKSKGGFQNMTLKQREKYREALDLATEMSIYKMYH